MTNQKRQQTIDSWHLRADAYEILVKNHRIFTDMAMDFVQFVRNNRPIDCHILDLAAGTGLISKLLLEHVDIPPSALYLVEPAERMCQRARENIPTAHVFQITAEDCLSNSDLPRDYFDFILCNASMHLMTENDIYPVVAKLLKVKQGYFLYTLWYHAFDETLCYDQDEEFESCLNRALNAFGYPNYFTENQQKVKGRSRRYLAEIAEKNGLRLDSCRICMHRIPLEFDLDFLLMSPNWLMEHLKKHSTSANSEEFYSIKERLIEKVREFIANKSTDKPVIQVIVSRRT